MSAINGKIIERIVNIPANTAFESFSKFLKLKKFKFHEIFHIFILLGSLCQYLCVLLYVI